MSADEVSDGPLDAIAANLWTIGAHLWELDRALTYLAELTYYRACAERGSKYGSGPAEPPPPPPWRADAAEGRAKK